MQRFLFVNIISVLLSGNGFTQSIDICERLIKSEGGRDYDAKHYKIELTIDFDQKYFTGENAITEIIKQFPATLSQ